jgi:uncharacterized membrane protein YfcA
MEGGSVKPAILLVFGVLVGAGASLTGLGGGFLVVPLLILLGFTPQRAVGTSFMAILAISISALFAHARLAQVDYRLGLLLGLGGVAGAQIGARLLQHVSAPTFNRICGVLLLGLAARMLLQK